MTTSDYLEQLQQDKQDLIDNLETKGITGLTGEETFTELVPQVLDIPSGGTPNITTLSELNTYSKSVFDNYYNYINSIINNYEAYTNENITLYTPDENTKRYMIQKKASGKFRIVWGSYEVIRIASNSSQEFQAYRIWGINYTAKTFTDLKNMIFNILYFTALVSSDIKFYYSNEFDTFQQLIEALQDETQSNISYTSYSGGVGFSGIIDNSYPMLYSNCLLIDNGLETILNGKIISHNETITTVSNV